MMKNAIVTGGSRGIGEQLVYKLGEMGYNVIINYNSDKSKALTDKIIETLDRKYKVKGYAIQGDVSKYEDCQKIVKFAYDKLGHIDVLVNNAGIASPNVPFTKMTVEQYTKVIGVNLFGTFHMCHLVVPHMVKAKKGCVVNVSSVGGLMGVAGQVDYCASKSGVIGMTRGLAVEFAKDNIRFNCICPGMMWTDLLKNIDKDKLDALAKTVPLGRMGDIADAASTMEFLIKNEYMTGQYVSPNGGLFIP